MNPVEDNNVSYIRARQHPVHCLFIGASLSTASSLFQRKVETVTCDHVERCDEALETIINQAKERPYDCVMADMRHQDAAYLEQVVNLANLGAFGQFLLLADPDNADACEAVAGVERVLRDPIQPIEIVKAIVASANPPRLVDGDGEGGEGSDGGQTDALANAAGDQERLKVETPSLAPTTADLTGDDDPSPADDNPAPDGAQSTKWWQMSASARELKRTVSPVVEKVKGADRSLWQRFVPLISFLYKKVAIVLLSALFLTFVAYGAMIVFFMTNDNWSLPLELSRGHVLVEKTERDLSSLSIRRNQLRQDLTSATAELSNAERAKLDGERQILVTRRTIEQELSTVQAERDAKLNQIARLNKVLADFDKISSKDSLNKGLKKAYDQRLITKAEMNKGVLSVLETMHRLAVVEGEIAFKKIEAKRLDASLTFLSSLLVQIDRPEFTSVPTASSNFAHLARDVIAAKTLIASAETTLASAKLRTGQLENSFKVISQNLASLEKSPAARALKAPVTVLFVPYDNVDSVRRGDPLLSCALTIFFCSQVGSIGPEINGETTAVHPLFGKPMRGVFVEAEFNEAGASNSELVHAGSAPLWF